MCGDVGDLWMRRGEWTNDMSGYEWDDFIVGSRRGSEPSL